MKLLREMTTGKDNVTYDVVRVTLTIFAVLLPLVLVWGMTMQSLAYFQGKPFDMQGSFNGVMAFLVGAGGFLTGGGVAIKLKSNTDDMGGTQTTETIVANKTTTQG